jgi:Zn-dependent M28 family amino/carboxypeptidase
MIDDHTPFLEKGITAVDIIDFDYPWWHTTADTAERISSQSLGIIGNVLLAWLAER